MTAPLLEGTCIHCRVGDHAHCIDRIGPHVTAHGPTACPCYDQAWEWHEIVAPQTGDVVTGAGPLPRAYVEASPNRMSGQVCIGGTRITTATFRALRDERGLDIDRIKALYPYLTREQIVVALWWEDEAVAAPSVELVQALLESENVVDRLTAERDALQAMIECCRELVPDLSYEAQTALSEIVGWPAEISLSPNTEDQK